MAYKDEGKASAVGLTSKVYRFVIFVRVSLKWFLFETETQLCLTIHISNMLFTQRFLLSLLCYLC